MNRFVRNLVWGCLSFFMTGALAPAQGQSVFDPNDPIVIYNPSNPPVEPAFGQPDKWVKTNRLPWNTSSFKAYIYKGIAFRLKWPKNYDASGNTKYPLFLFFHGKGERGSIYDNEYQLFHGGELHRNAVDNGTYNGFLLYPQTSDPDGHWSTAQRQFVMELIENFLIPEVNVDPFRISVDGLSGGGFSTWKFFEFYPKLVAACLPISSSSSSHNTTIVNNKFTPIWLFQGALDLNPMPSVSQYLNGVASNAGANFTYTEYPNLGHGCWYAAWGEPDYFPFLNRANKANPWPLYGRTEFCNVGPGSVNTTIGVTAGFNEYQWQKNGELLTGLGTTSNTLTVTDVGVYSCRIRKGTTWSEWSPIPVEIKYKTSTIPPAIKVSGLASRVLPSPDGKTTVNLEVPATYSAYNWQKAGDPPNTPPLSTGNVLNGAAVGEYKVQVTEQFGCSSAFTDPFKVINANGSNKPDPATGLIVIPLSYTSLKLNWSSNPNPVYPQTGFEIYQATQSGGPYQFVSLVNGNVFSFVKEGLTPGVKYYYIVRAVNNTAAAPVSNEASATTQKDTNPPTAPGNLNVTGSARNYVSLSWAESTDDVGLYNYEIYVNGIKSFVTSETEYTVYGLDFGKSYNFTVKAVDIAGNKSAASNQVTAQPLAKGLTFKHYTGSWDNLPDFNTLTPILTGVVPNVTLANTTQAENYAFLWEGYIRIPSSGDYVFRTTSDDGSKLYLSTYNHTAQALVSNDGLHGSVSEDGSIDDLAAGVYPIAITFFQKGGGANMSISWRKRGTTGWSMAPIPDSAFVDPPSLPAGTAPAKPSNLAAAAVSFKRINLAWSDNSNNEKSFELYRSTNPQENFVTIGVLPANTTSFADTLVEPATTYYYKVRAINQYGESPFDKIGPGVDYAYYERTGMSVVPDFNTMTPVRTGRVSTFQLGMQLRGDNFAVKFDGYITVPTTGDYTFYLKSDDGSRLFINNNPVVNNDGLHDASGEQSGTVSLNAGMYPIRVTFFEATGGEALTVSYQGPGINKQTIPGNILGDVLANATTLAPPPAPAAPTNLTALGFSKSAINIKWVNNALTNIKNIELYRSYNGNTDYVLLATLPANATSYNDTELYPSSLFYYKVRATGEGGNSAYSNEKDARTLGVVPSILPVENVYMRFNSTVQVPIEATSGSPVAITLQVSNLPDFATFQQTDNGKGIITFSPSETQQGLYTNIAVTASNPQNDKNTAQFNLTVNSNYVPILNNSITSISVNEMQTNQINLSATDDDADDYLIWSFTGLPSFATISTTNRTASVSFAPKYGDAGVYKIKATVKDGRNGKDTSSFDVKVIHVDAPHDPNDGTVPAQPKDIAVQFVSSANGVQVTWTNMAYNATGFEIYRATSVTGHYTLLNPGATNKDSTSYYDYTAVGNQTYFYAVRAINANGGTNSTIVMIVTPNRAPMINVEDIYIKSGDVNNVNIIASDDPGDIITLTALNLPSFATFTDNGNGNGVLQLSPSGAHVGIYYVSIKAIDHYGSPFVKPVKIVVTDKNITSFYVNFNNKDYPISFEPWNSFNAAQVGATAVIKNTILSNLKEETGGVSNLSVQLLDAWAQTYGGMITGNNSGVFPDSVMMSGYYFYTKSTVPQKTIRISGLNSNKRYNLIFFGSRQYTQAQVTYFTAGGQTVSLNATNNSTQTTQINSLAPSQGIIDVVIKADMDRYAVISAMVIQEYDNTIILPPFNLKMDKSTRNSISLSWKCNASNVTAFEIWRSDTPNGTYVKLPATIPGNVFTYTDGGLQTGTLYYYKVRAVSGSGFSDFSDYVSGATIKYAININFNDGSELGPSQPAPWNNTNQLVYEGFTLPNLLNDDNQNTGINMTIVGSLNSFSGTNRQDNTLTTGNNSGAVPDIVMSTFYFLEYGQVGKIRIDGLNQTMRYNFVFYGGCKDRGKGQVTTYTIGNEMVNLDAKNNTMNTVQINNVAPDAAGSVLISLTPTILSGFGYINSLSIQAVDTDTDNMPSGRKVAQAKGNVLSKADSTSELKAVGNIILGAYPNPFVDDITLKLSLDNPVNRVVVVLKDISGKSIFSTTLMNLHKGISERKLGLNGARLSPGIYGIQLLGLPKGEKAAVIVVK